MTKEHQAILAEMALSAHGQALRALLEETYAEIGDVEDCTSWEDTIGRKHAKAFLKKTFSFLDKPEVKLAGKNIYT